MSTLHSAFARDEKSGAMERPFQQILVQKHGEVYAVRLRHLQLDEKGLEELGAEIARLIDEDGCRKIVLLLGPEDPLCLFSVFLAKLVNLQRRLEGVGGSFALARLSDTTRKIFRAAGLEKFFRFYATEVEALAALK